MAGQAGRSFLIVISLIVPKELSNRVAKGVILTFGPYGAINLVIANPDLSG